MDMIQFIYIMLIAFVGGGVLFLLLHVIVVIRHGQYIFDPETDKTEVEKR